LPAQHGIGEGLSIQLARRPDGRKDRHDGSSPKTEKTIMDKTVLLKELKKAKARQYAMSEEEYLPGLITISAPLFDPLTGKGCRCGLL
jgi:DNA-binding IclR family transcriptional regulator